MVRLAKVRDTQNVVHILDLDKLTFRPVCELVVGYLQPTPPFIDDLSIGCPECRTFVVDWLLGRGVSREARQLVRDDIERQPCDCPSIPAHPRFAHGASGIGQGPR